MRGIRTAALKTILVWTAIVLRAVRTVIEAVHSTWLCRHRNPPCRPRGGKDHPHPRTRAWTQAAGPPWGPSGSVISPVMGHHEVHRGVHRGALVGSVMRSIVGSIDERSGHGARR